jgi:hypothetical protein
MKLATVCKTGIFSAFWLPVRMRRLGAVALVLASAAAATPALALEVLPDEKASREACERRFCEIVLDGKDKGPPLACDMTKTWDRVKIKKNGEKNALSWGFGDARCRVALKIPRDRIVPAINSRKHVFQFDRQTINCKVEGSDRKLDTLEVDAAPKIKFKNGRAYKVWINIKDVRGDSGLKGLVWTVSGLADKLGLFHSATVKEINKFIHRTCNIRYGKGVRNAKKGADKKDKPLRADAR